MRTLVRVRIPSQRTVRRLSLGASLFLILALVSSGTYLLGAAHAASAAPLAVAAPQPINAGKTCVVTATQERLDTAPDLSRDGLSSNSADYTGLHPSPAPSNYRCYADDHSAVAAITGGVLNVPENLHGKAATDWVTEHIASPGTVGSGRGAHVVRVPRYLPTLTNLVAYTYTYTGTNYTGTVTYLVLPVVYLCASPYTGYGYYASLTVNLSSFLVRSVITGKGQKALAFKRGMNGLSRPLTARRLSATSVRVRKTFLYRLYPTKEQQRLLARQLEECRWLWNHLLAERRDAWEQRQETLRLYDQQTTLPMLKAERPALAGVHSQVLQNVAVRLDLAFKAFFRRVQAGEDEPGYPRFRGVGRYDSLTFPQVPVGCRLVESDGQDGRQDSKRHLHIHGVGQIKVVWHRPLDGTPKTATIRRHSTGKWYVAFSCECAEPTPLPSTGQQVGLDMGLVVFAMPSEGDPIPNPHFFRSEERALAKAQRRLAREEQGTPERVVRLTLGEDGQATYYRRREAVLSLSHLGDSWERPTVERPYGLLAIDEQNPGLLGGRGSNTEPLAGVMGFKLNPELAKYFADDQAA